MNSTNTECNKNYSGLWKDSIPKVAWGTVCLFLGLVVGYATMIVAIINQSLPYYIVLPVLAYLAFAGFTVMHEAGHGNIFQAGSKWKALETPMGWIASLPLLLMPYRHFQKLHDRHHAFTNDPDRDPDYMANNSTPFHIIFNTLALPIKYLTLVLIKFRHIKVIRGTYFSTAVYLCVVAGILTTLIINIGGEEVVLYLLLPNLIAVFFLAMFFDTIPHFPQQTLGRYHDTRIIIGKRLKWVMLGQNYHLIHHMYPRVPWNKYDEVFDAILPDLEKNGAPIEEAGSLKWPGLFKSKNVVSMQLDGERVNMSLAVESIEHLTSKSVAITFANPEGSPLKYEAGQYINVSKWLNNEQQTRCYSLCMSPSKGKLKIGVKATEGGLVSNYLNSELKVGDQLIVEGPFGDFSFTSASAENVDELVLIARGSGITPVMAILEKALSENLSESIHLIYANNRLNDIMFMEHLEQLQTQYPKQLKVSHVLGEGPSNWTGPTGYIDDALLTKLLSKSLNKAAFYICGPEPMKNAVLDALNKRDISNESIHVEQFVSAIEEPIGELFPVEISLLDGQKHTVEVAGNQTVLQVAKAEGITIPHACGSGTCGSCKMKVNSGSVAPIPETIPGLLPEEQDIGYTLACQCYPESGLKISSNLN